MQNLLLSHFICSSDYAICMSGLLGVRISAVYTCMMRLHVDRESHVVIPRDRVIRSTSDRHWRLKMYHILSQCQLVVFYQNSNKFCAQGHLSESVRRQTHRVFFCKPLTVQLSYLRDYLIAHHLFAVPISSITPKVFRILLRNFLFITRLNQSIEYT